MGSSEECFCLNPSSANSNCFIVPQQRLYLPRWLNRINKSIFIVLQCPAAGAHLSAALQPRLWGHSPVWICSWTSVNISAAALTGNHLKRRRAGCTLLWNTSHSVLQTHCGDVFSAVSETLSTPKHWFTYRKKPSVVFTLWLTSVIFSAFFRRFLVSESH